MQQVRATVEGVIVYRLQLGDRVRPGDVIGEIVPPFGTPQPILAETEGVLFARHNQPWAWPGKVIAKVAGAIPLAGRSGDLLSP
jgi:predicted deacylase